MIYKLMNEMDRLSPLSHRKAGADLSDVIQFGFGREEDKGILSLYAALFGNTKLDAGEKYRLQFIYVTDEKGGTSKMFIRDQLNPQFSGSELALIKQQAKIDIMEYFRNFGHEGYAPLMNYSFDIHHGIERHDFANVLRESGFLVPAHSFKCNNEVVTELNNKSELCLLPNDQLMSVIKSQGNVFVDLADSYLVHSPQLLLTTPPKDKLIDTNAIVSYCNLEAFRNHWNDYVAPPKVSMHLQ